MGQILVSNYGDFPEIESDSIAIFSVPEFRGDSKDIKFESQSLFRKELLQLSRSKNWKRKIYDLGTIVPGENLNDTYFGSKVTPF